MQRSLHRETPIPGKGLEPPSKRTSATLSHLSVGSIQESEEEFDNDTEIRDSATSLMENRGWTPGNGKSRTISTSPLGKPYAKKFGSSYDSMTSKDLVGPKTGSRRTVSNSGQSSPTGSLDSQETQGSGVTFRSMDSLHRTTPIPSDASGSFAGGGSFVRRPGGRAQPQTPTISEFEDDPTESPIDLATLPGLLSRNQSIGENSVAGSLHRTTPMPTDLSSSSGRLYAHRSTTPTIQENDYDRLHRVNSSLLRSNSGDSLRSIGSLHRDTPMPLDLNRTSAHSAGHSTHPVHPTICEEEELVERVSDLDSNEHYYGRPERLGDSESLQAKPKVAPTADSRTPSSRTRSQKLVQPPQPEGQGDMGSPKPPGLVGGDAAAGESPVTNSRGEEVGAPAAATASMAPGAGLSPSTSGKLHTSSQSLTVASPPSPFSPFVESKDWERDILGVARFLRMCPGLSRQLIGDLLGENNERCLRVLECFTASFDFTGLSFEAALREYLESFRLPGESQKIYRILESWSRQFFRQCPAFFRNSDAVLVLAFSLVLLNTDRHKSTVKTKMTCEEFVRNNRGGNDGQDFPRDFLEELFRHIERRAIRIPPAHPAENSLRHNSLPEPIRATKKQYESPERARPTGWLCF